MLRRFFIFSLFLFVNQPLWAEWSGSAGVEYRHFPAESSSSQQHDDNTSVFLQPEFNYKMDNGHQLFSFIPYYRQDEHDPERSHGDIRELSWVKSAYSWELRMGIRKVFWGVTESQHLVDIINQSDLVENISGEDKLGQPMVNLALIGDYGTVDLFVLPYFRERTFPGKKGWPRPETYYVDTNQDAIYQSDKKQKHIDYAARWTKSIGVWDIGLSYFTGTSRDPVFTVGTSATGDIVLIPVYKLINQVGLDVQATVGSWLWKLETIHRTGMGKDYTAATGGFEYTFYGIAGSDIDLGLVMEYMYDNRAKASATPFDDDVLLACRFNFNDAQSTDALIGVIKDREYDTTLYKIEAGHRIGNNWKLNLEARYYENVDPRDAKLYPIRNNDYIQMGLSYYF